MPCTPSPRRPARSLRAASPRGLLRSLPALLAPLALLLASAGTASAQETFSDNDFFFEMQLPPGLVQLSDEQRAAFLGVPVVQIANRPRGDSKTATLSHDYVWIDPPGADERHRQVEVNLMDQSKWLGEQHFVAWLESGGLTVTRQDTIPRPVGPAKLVEGTFVNAEGRELTQITVYLPRLRGYGLVRFQCDSEDFPLVEPEFRASLESIRLRLPIAPPPGTPNPHDVVERAVRPGAESGGWGKYQVWGSFLLAGLLLAALVKGGPRATSAASPSAPAAES